MTPSHDLVFVVNPGMLVSQEYAFQTIVFLLTHLLKLTTSLCEKWCLIFKGTDTKEMLLQDFPCISNNTVIIP